MSKLMNFLLNSETPNSESKYQSYPHLHSRAKRGRRATLSKKKFTFLIFAVDKPGGILIKFALVMGQQLRKRVKRQRRLAREKRLKERARANMKK
ncbi:MAG: hypothetical protein IJU44_10555 [Kiritimatiellae bacterium]|nr:hypothetical protein [Kiritimatiellia bacterium]